MNKPMTQADIYKAIEEIDEVVSKKLLAIEQAEKQEPVAWMYKGNFHDFDPSEWASPKFVVTPLYTAPPKQTPVAWRKKVSGVWHYFDESTPFPFDDCEPLYEKN
jgi:hypothetical protein